MADLTKAQLAARVLEHLGVKEAGSSADASDTALVEEAIDAAWERLRKFGLVPFATSAVPPWAQIPLRDYVAADVAPAFGKPVNTPAIQAIAKRELQQQVSGYRHNMPIVTDYF